MKRFILVLLGILILAGCEKKLSNPEVDVVESMLPPECSIILGNVDFDTTKAGIFKYITCLNPDGDIIILKYKEDGIMWGEKIYKFTRMGASYCPGPDSRCAELKKTPKQASDSKSSKHVPKKAKPPAKETNLLKDLFNKLKGN